MKVFASVLLALCVVSASAVSLRSNQALSLMSEVRGLGKSEMIDDIVALIDAGAPLDDILSLLDKIEQDVIQEQDDHDNLDALNEENYQTSRSQKEDEIASLESKISDLSATIGSLTATIYDLNAKIVAKKDDIDQTQNAIQNNIDDDAATDASRAATKELYDTSVADHEDAIDAIDEVEDLLRGSTLVGAAFTQQMARTSSRLVQMGQKYKGKIGRSVSAKAMLFKALAASAAPGDINKLLDLLIRLRDELSASLDEAHDAEAASIESYNKRKADLAAELEALENSLAEHEAQLADLESSLASAVQDRADAEHEKALTEEQLSLAQQVLADLIETRQQQVDHYKKESARRAEELDIISQAREIIIVRLSGNAAVNNLE